MLIYSPINQHGSGKQQAGIERFGKVKIPTNEGNAAQINQAEKEKLVHRKLEGSACF